MTTEFQRRRIVTFRLVNVPRGGPSLVPTRGSACRLPGRMVFAVVVVLVAVLAGGSVFGCGGRHSFKEDDEGGYQSSVSMPLSKTEGTLQAAQQARTDGRYKQAADGFAAVYQEKNADEDLRSQALFGLAEVYAALTNPAKDLSRAVSLFERVLVEFPRSELGEQAERRIVEIRTLLGTQRDG